MSNGTIDWTLGLKVRITTLLDDKITGTVYAFCHTTNTITLIQEPSSGESSANVKTNNGSNNSSAPSGQIQRPNYRIIKTSFVKEVIVISRPKQTQSSSAAGPAQGAAYKDAFVKAVPQIGHIDISRLNARAEAAVQAELKRRSQIGVGVSKEGQALFDMLSKTVPCFWHEKSIIAMEEVRIDPPYSSEYCIADNAKSPALRYVQTLVDGIREKLASSGQIKGG